MHSQLCTLHLGLPPPEGWQTPEPKELIVLEGSAHAQFIFATDQGERLMREILRFLSAP
jgi:hypothetical protein